VKLKKLKKHTCGGEEPTIDHSQKTECDNKV
ncbi:uncharacterized protein METZ01_LOCUS123926, partial [marine metagenome]